MDATEAVKLEVIPHLKAKGNDHFNKRLFARAIFMYDVALKFMRDILVEEEAPLEDQETKHLLVVLYSNKAEALLKLGAFALAKQACEYALLHDPHHTKSIHRKKRAEEVESLHDKNVAILRKYTNELSEIVDKGEFGKQIKCMADMTKFAKENMGGLTKIQCLSMCAGLYWSQSNVTGCRKYLEPANQFAQNCLELCETLKCSGKIFEIDPGTLDPKYSLAELLITRAECSMLAARLTECKTGDRSAAAAEIASVIAELSDVSDMASKYDTIAFEVAEKKLKSYAAIVALETDSRRWTKAKTAAQKMESIFKDHSTKRRTLSINMLSWYWTRQPL